MMISKKLIFGILIVVLLTAVISLFLFGLEKPTATNTSIPVHKEIEDPNMIELKRLNIEVTGQPKQIKTQLPLTLSDANWGLKKIICEDGGYDLSAYAGRTLLLTSYPINEIYDNKEPLTVWVVSSGNEVVCVYKTVRQGGQLMPGIFSIKDNSFIKKIEK